MRGSRGVLPQLSRTKHAQSSVPTWTNEYLHLCTELLIPLVTLDILGAGLARTGNLIKCHLEDICLFDLREVS